ncbi:MAG: radical SAM protein [Nitrospirota bacterium]
MPDFIFVSMPYARFISRWFANVPNVNLGIMQSFLTEKGKSVKTFHFHLEFLPFIQKYDSRLWKDFLNGSEHFGVEYIGLDYVFATLIFRDKYELSKEPFRERLGSVGLTLDHFEEMRRLAEAFVDLCFSKLSPYLKGTKLIGFSCSHYQLSGSLLLCSMVKKACPGIKSVFGGKDCTGAFGYEMMKNIEFVDFVGTSECEVTVESLLEYMNGNGREIYNVLYRNNKGEIENSESKPNVSLDFLPLPQYDFQNFSLKLNELILPIEFGRGCPWKKCTFCPDESYNIKCQSKTSGRLESEIEHYQSISKDLRNFFILDSDALKDRNAIIELSNYLGGKGFIFHYAEFRAERMDRDVLGALLRFGKWASHFQIGIETFSDHVLKLMNKGVTVLKNVEVLKAVAELGVPVQFNLFTCFPGMSTGDMIENNRIMDLIAHILVCENIQIYPGEFYLPSDCPVFIDIESYGIKRHSHSIFSLIFEDFPMPSYSNYPYPYQFDNDEEQFKISETIRGKVAEIKRREPDKNFMLCDISPDDDLAIKVSRNGWCVLYTLRLKEKDLYIAALEKYRRVDEVAQEFGLSPEEASDILGDFERKGLILYSADRKSFLSLAMRMRQSSFP